MKKKNQASKKRKGRKTSSVQVRKGARLKHIQHAAKKKRSGRSLPILSAWQRKQADRRLRLAKTRAREQQEEEANQANNLDSETSSPAA